MGMVCMKEVLFPHKKYVTNSNKQKKLDLLPQCGIIPSARIFKFLRNPSYDIGHRNNALYVYSYLSGEKSPEK